MPAAGRLADIGSGHGCFPPSPTIQGSGDVFTNFRPALRKGDAVLPHACGQCPPHGRKVSAGSATVNINSKPAARVNDAISCGGSVSTGSGDVVIGDDSYGSGTGEVKPIVRFVISQVPGSTAHGYYKEPYKLYHNGGVVKEGRTDENGVIEFEPDEMKGEFKIEAVNQTWKLEVRALAPADTEAGVKDRLAAMSYHVSDDVMIAPNDAAPETIQAGLAWFQTDKEEGLNEQADDVVKDLLRAIVP